MRSLALAAVLLAVPSFAQVSETITTDQSRGMTLMPESAAYADQATAGVYNPAGVTHVSALELFYAHERSIARGQTIDGVWLASSIFDALGTALSVEWIRGGGDDHRKTSWSLAAGPEALSAGVTFNWFSGGSVNGIFSVDLGLQSRFSRYASLGVALKNVDAPGNGTVSLVRKLDVGLGLRPFGERFTLGIDFVFDEQHGAANGRMAYSLKAQVLKGLSLHAGASHGFNASQGLFLTLGLTVDLANFGAGFLASGATEGMNYLLQARLSVENYPSLPVSPHQIAVVGLGDLGELKSAGTVATLLGLPPEDRFLRTMVMLHEAEKDPRLKGVVLKVEESGLGFGRAKELRDAIVSLRKAGKSVVAYVLSATDADYFIATAAEQIYAAPEAMLLIDGLQSNVLFLGGAAEKLGVTVDVARVGAYKNSPDQFTRKDMSAEQREAISAYLDTDVKTIAEAVTSARKLSKEAWAASIDEGLKSCKRAKELNLIDDILSPAQFEERLGTDMPGGRLVAAYRPFDERTGRWGFRSRIALISVVGTIGGGKNQQDPLGLSTTAGADSFIRAIESAAADPLVRAIVVRVDSPGGDGLASDLMYRAVLEARKKKPVVASMGDVAASGGYYAAMGADEIWASPTTITGSIGVFFIKPAVKDLALKLGVTQESVTRGALAGSTEFYEPWTDAQRTAAQKWVDAFYDNFITEAASSRKLAKEAVDLVARGRVWSGEDAKAHGLVDQLGGLPEAVNSARVRAELNDDFDLVTYGGSNGMMSTLIQGSALEAPLERMYLPQSTSSLTQAAQLLGLEQLELTGGLKAHLGYRLTVR